MAKADRQKPNTDKHQPPAWADRFLEWYCSSDLIEEIQGDLHEAFHLRVKRYGFTRAKCLFIIEVIRFFRPSSFQQPVFYLTYKSMKGLSKNYLVVAKRHIFRNKGFSIINITGLAIGMVAFLLILQYLRFEQSYDLFHKHIDQLYRVTLTSQQGKEAIQSSATNYHGVGIALKNEFSEVQDYARLVNHKDVMPPAVVSAERQDGAVVKFREDNMYFADATFLSMFSYPLLAGEATSALKDPNYVVLTASTAKKYFGEEDPIGKMMLLDGDHPLTVTAVLKDIPENTHLQFDLLISFATLHQEDQQRGSDVYNSWISSPDSYTYVLLNPEADPVVLESKFPKLVDKYTQRETNENRVHIQLSLQPVADIHLKSDLLKEASVNGSENMVYFLTIIAASILLIAFINYINLSTATAVERAKEVSLRKTVGASKGMLIGQFLLESTLLSLISIFVAFFVVGWAAPYFNEMVGKQVITDHWWRSLYIWKVVACMLVAGCLLAGVYPAILLSSFQPKQVLKGRFSSTGKGLVLRKSLVIFQFAVSVALIAGTITIYKQLAFMQNKELGYQAEQVLIVNAPTLFDDMAFLIQKAEVFKHEVAKQTTVRRITVTNEIPGRILQYALPVRKSSDPPETNISCYWISTDEHFMNTFQIKLAAGRWFKASDASKLSPESTNRVLLNEKAARLLGFHNPEEAIQQRVTLSDRGNETPAEVIGIVKNFHQRSLKEDYDPLIFQYPTYYQTLYFCMHVHTANINQTLAAIEQQYEKLFPENPFEYFFLDDYFNRQYQAEQQFGRTFLLFSVLAICIASMGLFGLASFVAVQKTKEIGIRKVLGASVVSILTLLSLDFFKLILFASLIIMPLAYAGLEEWLAHYAFRIDIGWWLIVLPILIVMTVAMMAVSMQCLKAALASPVKSLRHE